MGTLIIGIITDDPTANPFGDGSMFDACIDPQFNGVFPDDPALGIVSERKANVRPATNSSTSRDPRQGEVDQR